MTLPAGSPKAPELGQRIVAEAQKFLGDPYVYGATGPSAFDCSGLVQYTLSQLGVDGVPRTSEEQWSWVTQIKKSQLQPGDLVFAQFPGDNASPGHVGVYTGGGQVLSAEDPAQGVGYASLSSWGANIVGYGRVPGANGDSSAPPTAPAAGTTAAQSQSVLDTSTGLVSDAGALLHGAAESLNFFWEFFQPGQGWRLAFGAGAIALGYFGLRQWGIVPPVSSAAKAV